MCHNGEEQTDKLKNGFCRQKVHVVFAAISSSSLLLSKSGVLNGRKFTSGYFMQMADTFSFVEKEKKEYSEIDRIV